MAVLRYEPWNVVSQLQNEINRVKQRDLGLEPRCRRSRVS